MKRIKLYEDFKKEMNKEPNENEQIEEIQKEEDILQGLLDRVQFLIDPDETGAYKIETPDEAIEALNTLLDVTDEDDAEPIINLIEEIEEYVETSYNESVVNEGKQEGKIVFEMTGSPRDAMQMLPPKERTKSVFAEALRPHGYVHGRLNQDCDLLITDSKDSGSLKMQKAEDYGCKIVTYDSMIKKYKLFK